MILPSNGDNIGKLVGHRYHPKPFFETTLFKFDACMMITTSRLGGIYQIHLELLILSVKNCKQRKSEHCTEKKETWLHYTDTVSYRRRWEIADPLRKDRCRKWLQSILSDLEKTNASTRILILGEGCIFMELLSQLSERPQQMDITFAPVILF